MSRLDFELAKDDYEELKDKNHSEIWKYMNDGVTSPLGLSILCGYGLYGVGKPFEKNGKYYINIEIGSTCD